VNLIQKTVSINEESIKIQRDNIKSEKQQRKLNIKPNFRYELQYNEYHKNSSIIYSIKNCGEYAKHVDCILLQGNCIKVEKTINNDNSVLKGKIFMLSFNTTVIDRAITECSGKFQLTYEDFEENKYEQIIEVLDGKVNFLEPIELIEPIENQLY
jgi:hypothetical protein